MADPFAYRDPFAALDPFAGPRRKPAAFPPLPDEEADSAIQNLTSAGLSGLGYVGSTLDKFFGGRAVRGGLHALAGGGSARELLSAIPGSDVVGLTDPEQTVRGEDLWRDIGYDPSQGNWAERNLVGPAAEIALDPSVWFGGIGGLTAAGKAASKTGKLTRGFLPAVAKGERGLIYGLTGQGVADAAGAVGGAAKAAGRVGVNQVRKLPGGKSLVAGGEALADITPLALRSLFDTKAGPVANRVVQAANEFTRVPARIRSIRTGRRNAFDLYNQIQPVLDAGANPEDVYRFLTQAGEGVQAAPPPGLMPHFGTLNPVADKLRALYDKMPAREHALGLSSPTLGGDIDLEYMLRRAVKSPSKGSSRAEKVFRTTNASQLQRKRIFDQPGGTVQLEDWIRDPAMSGVARTMAPKAVAQKILDANMDWAQNYTGSSLPLKFPQRAAKRSKGLADYLGTVKDEYIDLPGPITRPTTPFFSRDVPANYLARATRGADVTSAAKAVYDVIRRVGAAGKAVPDKTVAVPKVLGKAGLQGIGAYKHALRALGQDPKALVAVAQNAAQGGSVDVGRVLRDALKGYSLPIREAAASTKYMNRFTTPEEIGPVKALADSVLNLTKAFQYAIWPASHVRNLTSGVAENAVEGMSPLNPAYRQASELLRGATPSPERTATMREMFGEGIIGQPQGEFSQAVGVRMPEVGTGNPALPRPSVAAAARPWMDVKGAALDPFGVAGFNGRQVSTNPWVRAGRDVSTAIEDRLRVGQYLDLKRKGYTPAAAAALVKKTHVDYQDLTDFERHWAKRFVPYYTFTSRNVPKQVGRAVTRPGTVSAPIRLGTGSQDEGYVPEYLRSGLAAPVGDQEDGTQRYLSGLGLPFEEAFSRLKVGQNPYETATKTAEGLLGMLRPELRAILESATGRQFYSGRDLADLRPGTLESALGLGSEDAAGLLSQFMSATPASRFVTTANRMLDPRKGFASNALSLLSGTKLTDVDVEKWRGIDARKKLERIMQHEPNLRESVDYYPTPEAKVQGAITPEQEYELRLYAAMKARAKAAAEQKRIGVRTGG